MLRNTLLFLAVYIAVSAAFAGAAFAHSGAGSNGFSAGFYHPVLGYDHLLAMVSVGVLSAQMGGRAVWTVPATFVTVMAAGGLVGLAGIALPIVETGIILSVIVLGGAIAAERRISANLAHFFVGLFALFHGHAHGSEMPVLASPALYAAGFILSTAILHLTGVALGLGAVWSRPGSVILRNCGALMAAFGVYMILNR